MMVDLACLRLLRVPPHALAVRFPYRINARPNSGSLSAAIGWNPQHADRSTAHHLRTPNPER